MRWGRLLLPLAAHIDGSHFKPIFRQSSKNAARGAGRDFMLFRLTASEDEDAGFFHIRIVGAGVNNGATGVDATMKS
jgi:hypothetical protein